MVSRVTRVWSLLIEAADLSQSTLIIFSKGSSHGLSACSVYFAQASIRINTIGLRQGVTGLISPCGSFFVPPSSCSVSYILNFILCPACKEQHPPPTTPELCLGHAESFHSNMPFANNWNQSKMAITKRMVSLKATMNLTFIF